MGQYIIRQAEDRAENYKKSKVRETQIPQSGEEPLNQNDFYLTTP